MPEEDTSQTQGIVRNLAINKTELFCHQPALFTITK